MLTISHGLFLENVIFNTVKTNLWKSDNPKNTACECWNDSALFVKNKSMQLGLETFLKRVLSLTILDRSCW